MAQQLIWETGKQTGQRANSLCKLPLANGQNKAHRERNRGNVKRLEINENDQLWIWKIIDFFDNILHCKRLVEELSI